ncbi:MAG: ATP-binding protein [Bacteroidetes bacterium]|nr:ATP-binding protein [Bacteroidota bacterium]
METKENILARLTLQARQDYIYLAVHLVKNIAAKEGFTEKQQLHLETITEEACLNVIQHAFEPGDDGSFDLYVIRPAGRIVIAIEDKGLPFDQAALEGGQQEGLGLRLMKGLADEVRFYNLGKKGKRVELVKYLPMEDPATLMTDDDRKIIENKEVLSVEPVSFRMMTPADATGLTRCVYRTYGYSYGADYIYNPPEVREMLASGIIESFLAVTTADLIVGHLALIYHKLGAMVAESGQAVVDNRFRGRKLFEKMKTILLDYARKKGLYGVYSEAITSHPYSQKGNIALGAVETGFLLGYAPETVSIKTIEAKSKEMRISGLLYYLKTNEEPFRTLYVPENHKHILTHLISRIKLNREIGVPGSLPELPPNSIVNSKIRPEWGHAFISVAVYGNDFEPAMKSLIREIRNQKISAIFLDLPLCSRHTPHFYSEMEKMGFSFSCFIPEYEEGDVIRMQYLNNILIDPEKISVASDFGKEILSYIMNDLKN